MPIFGLSIAARLLEMLEDPDERGAAIGIILGLLLIVVVCVIILGGM
jgi:hypothetical protein